MKAPLSLLRVSALHPEVQAIIPRAAFTWPFSYPVLGEVAGRFSIDS